MQSIFTTFTESATTGRREVKYLSQMLSDPVLAETIRAGMATGGGGMGALHQQHDADTASAASAAAVPMLGDGEFSTATREAVLGAKDVTSPEVVARIVSRLVERHRKIFVSAASLKEMMAISSSLQRAIATNSRRAVTVHKSDQPSAEGQQQQQLSVEEVVTRDYRQAERAHVEHSVEQDAERSARVVVPSAAPGVELHVHIVFVHSNLNTHPMAFAPPPAPDSRVSVVIVSTPAGDKALTFPGTSAGVITPYKIIIKAGGESDP